jgi:hypothetical protein
LLATALALLWTIDYSARKLDLSNLTSGYYLWLGSMGLLAVLGMLRAIREWTAPLDEDAD